MAKGNPESNVKEFYILGNIDLQKFTSSFVGGPGVDINDGYEIESLPATPDLDAIIHKVIRIKGNSMAPTIQEGDLIIIESYQGNSKPKSGDVIAVILNGDMMIKIFEPGQLCLYLSSINQDYEPIRVYEEDECHIIGKAIKLIRDIRI